MSRFLGAPGWGAGHQIGQTLIRSLESLATALLSRKQGSRVWVRSGSCLLEEESERMPQPEVITELWTGGRHTSQSRMKVPTLGPSVNPVFLPVCLFTRILYNKVVSKKNSLSSVYASQGQCEK